MASDIKRFIKILVVDDDKNIAGICAHMLSKEGWDVVQAHSGRDALDALTLDHRVRIVLLDYKLPDLTGADVLKEIKSRREEVQVVIMTAHGQVDLAVELIRNGAADFVSKPFKKERLFEAIERAAKVISLELKVDHLTTALIKAYRYGTMIGNSEKIRVLFDKITVAAESDVTVLLAGESGTGKDLTARAIHYNGPRAGGPFIAINCAALPEELIESELFGYKKGAFTGASSDSLGLFRASQGGTLFLDEILSMPLSTQAKLLRVLQDKKIRPVGGTDEVQVDVRVVCATNQDLTEAIEKELLRKDLYYRISVMTIDIPPLRERLADIPLLVEHFVARFNKEFKKEIIGVGPDVLDAMLNDRWEGNIRQLENALASAFAVAKGKTLRLKDFPPFLRESARHGRSGRTVPTMQDAERSAVVEAMKASGGNKSRAASRLGISRKKLYAMIKKFKIST